MQPCVLRIHQESASLPVGKSSKWGFQAHQFDIRNAMDLLEALRTVCVRSAQLNLKF